MIHDVPNIPDSAQYSPTQAARILGISRPTFYDRAKRGFIKLHRYRDNNRQYTTGYDIKYYFRRRS